MLSVIIPCFNEEKLVKKSILEILKAIKISKISKYEIIFIDDGSEDKSCFIVEQISKKNKNIKIIKNKRNFGIGYNFFKGVEKSKEKNLIQIPADNSHPSIEISKILKFINKKYDLVTTYYSNNSERSALRNIFTLVYTPFLNFIYGTNFPYFNGLTLYKTKDLKKMKFTNSSFSYQIEIFVYLFYKYKTRIKIVPTILKDRKKGSKAFKLKNSFLVIVSIFRIFGKSLFYRLSNFFN
jgi:glycosyltransferase involved in cell wall biosynthesis|tara:strand:+ start:2121 stop:2834 length:714 start_codon:yes stop_codon:yes gene_type:complete